MKKTVKHETKTDKVDVEQPKKAVATPKVPRVDLKGGRRK